MKRHDPKHKSAGAVLNPTVVNGQVKPRLLDLFCCAGGAAMGYHRAGFEVVGIDKEPQPHYPFEFIQDEALGALQCDEIGDYQLRDFVAIHASPPCQHFTAYGRAVKDIKERYEDLIEPTRELLIASGLPYVIENVPTAPLVDPIMLCGSMFDIDVQRHRLFEANWDLRPHQWPCRHRIWGRRFKSSTGRRPNSRYTIEVGSWDEPIELQKRCMGVDWTITVRELSEAVQPAYTEFIGSQLIGQLAVAA